MVSTILNFNKKLFIALTLGFILTTIVGTITHECGHYLAAKYYGYNASINYAATKWHDPVNQIFMDTT
jgi:fatty acid desaturase